MNDFLKEKENLLNSIENNTSEHWKNYYKDVPIECIFDDLVIDINEIKRLTKENQQLKEQLEKERKTRKEAIKYLYEHSQYVDEYGIHYIKEDEYCVDYLLDILNIDKGE